jgi:DNA-binding NarL/FixJ family response regulator
MALKQHQPMSLPSDQQNEELPALTCLVLDRLRLVGQAVGGLLAEHCCLELVGVFSSLAQAIAFIDHSPPDLLLLDVHCESEQGQTWQDAAAALHQRNPDGRLIVITDVSEQFVPPLELEPILLGIVDKHHDWDDLVRMVIRMQEARPRRSHMSNPQWRLQVDQLAPRELRVFQALGRGLLNKEIAQDLGLSVHTVETYRKHISAKLSLSGAELIRAATLHRCTNPVYRFPSRMSRFPSPIEE